MQAATDHRQRRTSKGRQKIEIKKVEKEASRYVTFSKRKSGIFKKATELSTLCGAETAVILFSEHGKVFSSGNPDDVDEILERYLAGIEQVGLENLRFSSEIKQTEQEKDHLDALRELEETKRALKMVKNQKTAMDSEDFWWDLSMENMGKQELEGFVESLKELKQNVNQRIELIATYNASTAPFASGLNCEFFNSSINGGFF